MIQKLLLKSTKKIDDFGNDPLVPEITITTEVGGDEFMVVAAMYAKDKLNSNTVFRILVDGGQIDFAELHTSCSKPLFKGQIVLGLISGEEILQVIDGTLGGDENSILPNTADEKCIDNKDSKNTATIILKKAITNDNGGEITDPAEFLPKIDGEDVLFGEPIPITAKEPHIISEAVVPGYSFVLIAGDTECPSMLDEEFTVKKNKEITCTIYNDDNGDDNGGAAGVAFGFNGFLFENIKSPSDVKGDMACAENGNKPPCIEIQKLGSSTLRVVVDPALKKPDSTIIIWSLNPELPGPSGEPFLLNNCVLAGVFPASFDATVNGFGFSCPTIATGNWNINYAFVET